MAALSESELDFLKKNNLPIPIDIEEEEDDDEIPPEEPIEDTSKQIEDLNSRYPELNLSDDVSYDAFKKTQANVATGELFGGLPKIDFSKRDSLTYENMYGDAPEVTTFGGGENDLSMTDYVGSLWYDLYTEGTDSQVARKEFNVKKEDWKKAAEDLYNSDSFTTNEKGQKVFSRIVEVKDNNGEVIDFKQEQVLIPDPVVDQSAFNRTVEQTFRTLYQEFGGLVTEGAILGDSEFASSRPSMDLTGGQEIVSTILTLAAPGGAFAKGAKYGGRLIKTGSKADKLGNKAEYAYGAAGVAIAEAIVSSEGDEGLLIKGDLVQRTLPILGDAQAENVAMFIDGMAFNGAFDGLFLVMRKGVGLFKDKPEAVSRLLSNKALKQATTDGTVLNIVKYLDPEFENLKPFDMKLRLGELAKVLNHNKIMKLSLGDMEKEIAVDSTNAIMMGSEAYIRSTRGGLKKTATNPNGLDDAAFEEMVQSEAARMSTSMIALFRSQASSAAVSSRADAIPEQIGEMIQEQAKSLGGGNIDEAAQSVATSIVRGSDDAVSELTADVGDVVKQTDSILKAQETVLEDNPLVQDLIQSNTGGDNIFTSNVGELRQALSEIVSTEGYAVFKNAMDEVDVLYKNLPEASIDGQLLKDQLDEVVAATNALDGSGERAKTVLSDIFAGFKPRTIGVDAEGVAIKGDVNEAIENITNTITFKDLYELKAKLAGVIDSYRNDPTIQRRIIAFRNHITDAEDGQMAHVIANSSEEVASQFKAADDTYKSAMAKFTNSEPIRRLTDAMGGMRKFDTPQGAIDGPYKRGEPDEIIASSQFVDETMADSTGVLMTQLGNMLQGVRSTDELTGSFRDLFRAQAANALNNAIQTQGSKGDANPAKILFESFAPIKAQLQELGDTKLLDELMVSYRQIENAYLNLGDLALANDEVIDGIRASIKSAQEGVVKTLTDTPRGVNSLNIPGGETSRVTSSAKQILRTIMTSNNSANRIEDLLQKINDLPDEAQRKLATNSLRAVALDTIGEQIFTSGSGSMKSGTEARRSMASGAVKKLSQDDATNLYKSLNALYGQTPEMSEAVIVLVNKMYQTSLPTRLKTSQSGSDTVIRASTNNEIRDSVSTAILLTAGYMNPTAAFLRRMTSVPVAEAEKLQKEIAAHILATVVTDPAGFEQLLLAARDGYSATVKEMALDYARSVGSASYMGTRYEARVQEEDIFGEEDIFPVLDRDILQLFGG